MEIMTWKDKIKKAVGDNKYAKVHLSTEDCTSVYHYTGEGEATALKGVGFLSNSCRSGFYAPIYFAGCV